MAMEHTNIHQELFILVNGTRENKTVKESCNLQTVLDTKGNGIKISCMEMDYILMQIKSDGREYLSMAHTNPRSKRNFKVKDF
jgi:hypothetical protein